MCRECRERFLRHRRLAIPTCITARAWCTCRDACRDRSLAVSFGVGGGENVPGIPGACATRNFTYLVRSRCHPAILLCRTSVDYLVSLCFFFNSYQVRGLQRPVALESDQHRFIYRTIGICWSISLLYKKICNYESISLLLLLFIELPNPPTAEITLNRFFLE